MLDQLLTTATTIYSNEFSDRAFVRDWWTSLDDCRNYLDAFLTDWQAWSDNHCGYLQEGLILIARWVYGVMLIVTVFCARHMGRAIAHWHHQAMNERILKTMQSASVNISHHFIRASKFITRYSKDAYIAIAPIVKREASKTPRRISTALGFLFITNW